MIFRPTSSTSSARCRSSGFSSDLNFSYHRSKTRRTTASAGSSDGSQIAFKFARGKQAAEHVAMRAKNAGQGRIEFGLDPPSVAIDLRQGFLEGLLQTKQLAVDFLLADRGRDNARFEHVNNHPGLAHAQPGRDAPPA